MTRRTITILFETMGNLVNLRIITILSSLFLPVAALAGPITLRPTDLNLGDTFHLTFVTSTTRDATSSNIADYDAFVQAAADTAGGGLENVTWLAIGTTFGGAAAITHSPVSGPVYRLDDTRIANDQNDLWDGSIAATLSITEFGNSLSTDVWTGTKADGTGDAKSESHELGTTNKPKVAFGRSGFSSSSWIWQGTGSRNDKTDLFSVYGISKALTVSLVPVQFIGELSDNAIEVGNIIDTAFANDPELILAFFQGFTTAEEINAALESLAPDMSGAVQSATFAAHHFAIDNVDKRLASLRTDGGMMAGMAAGDPYQGVSMWLQGFGSTIDQDNRDLVAGFNADTVGATFGVDKLLNNNLRVGAVLSYAATDVETNGSGNTTDIDSYQGGLYASYESGPWYMDGVLYYAYNDYDGRRTIPLVGRVANADYDANQFGVKATLGREYSFNADTYLTPYVGLYYVYLDVDDYTETGAGAANLTVDNEENQALQSRPLGFLYAKR